MHLEPWTTGGERVGMSGPVLDPYVASYDTVNLTHATVSTR